MHLTTIARRRLLACLASVAGIVGSGQATAQQPTTPRPQSGVVAKIDPKTNAVLVPLGGYGRFDPGTGKLIKNIEVSNADVLVVRPVADDPKKVDLLGMLGGASQLTLTFADDSKASYSVIVQPDYEQLKFVIRQAVPTATVDIIPGVGNVIILSGSVSQPSDADTIIRIASSAVGGTTQNVINALQVGGSQHVMIDVTVAQVDRTELRERGFAFSVQGSTATFTSILGGLATVAAGTGGTGTTFTPGANANIFAGIVPSNFNAALRALKTEGLAKFLSEPKIVTQTGRPAFFRAGGQQATLSAGSGIQGPGVVLTPVGTELEVLPIVYGDGRIYLEVNPRISSVNNGRGITTAFGFTPGFNEQQVRSAIMLQSGQTFAIGGLLETTTNATTQKVPYLGELPLIGMAFSNVSYQETETELVILVTPRLVEPMDCNQVPRRVPGKESRAPDDFELFVESLIETPRGQRKSWSNGYVAAYKADPKMMYPCNNNLSTASGSLNVRGLKAPVAGANCEAAVILTPPAPAPQVAPAALPVTYDAPTPLTPPVTPLPGIPNTP
jgi:pilus assembly protein CpaC